MPGLAYFSRREEFMVFLGLNLLFKDKIRLGWSLDLGIGFLKFELPYPYMKMGLWLIKK